MLFSLRRHFHYFTPPPVSLLFRYAIATSCCHDAAAGYAFSLFRCLLLRHLRDIIDADTLCQFTPLHYIRHMPCRCAMLLQRQMLPPPPLYFFAALMPPGLLPLLILRHAAFAIAAPLSSLRRCRYAMRRYAAADCRAERERAEITTMRRLMPPLMLDAAAAFRYFRRRRRCRDVFYWFSLMLTICWMMPPAYC